MSGYELLSAVERIERLHGVKKDAEDDIREIYAEVAANGYDKKALRAVVKRRSQDATDRSDFEAIVDLYEQEIAAASRTRDTREEAA